MTPKLPLNQLRSSDSSTCLTDSRPVSGADQDYDSSSSRLNPPLHISAGNQWLGNTIQFTVNVSHQAAQPRGCLRDTGGRGGIWECAWRLGGREERGHTLGNMGVFFFFKTKILIKRTSLIGDKSNLDWDDGILMTSGNLINTGTKKKIHKEVKQNNDISV